MVQPAHADLQAQLARTGWVRSLARSLLGDEHLAEDALQESWRVALERSPSDGRPLFRWFTAVVRNFARQEHRSRRRRAAREQAVARPEVTEPDDEALERLELHRALVEAVHALPESYRTVICLRYFDGLTPSAIAERTQLPLRTVHTRLARALRALRKDLERTHGEHRAAWIALLWSASEKPAHVGEIALGVLVMNAKLKWALSIAALVLIAAPLCWLGDDATSAATPSAVAVVEPVRLEGSEHALEAGVVVAPPEQEVRTEVAQRASSAPKTVVVPMIWLPCRVLDVEGRPVPGVHVRFRDEPGAEIEHEQDGTDSNGYVKIRDPGRSGALEVVEARYTSMLSPDVYQFDPLRVIVVAERMAFAGVVLDADQNPVAGAAVAVRMPEGFRARFEHVLDQITLARYATNSGADGRFELAVAPRVADAFLSAEHVGFEWYSQPMPDRSDDHVEIVLRPLAPEQVLRGVVIDPNGAPAAGALVTTSHDTTKTDADGRFVLSLTPGLDVPHVEAVKQGYLPALIQPTIAAPDSPPVWPQPLILELGAPPLSIRGRVLHADGTPAPGVRVWTDDERRFGPVEMDGFEMRLSFARNVESLLRDGPHEDRVSTDGEGRFELSGLLPARYRLAIFDERSLVFTCTAPIDAGSIGVDVMLPRELVHARVAGRVLSRSGEPVSGVDVSLSRDVVRTKSEEPEAISGASVETDEDGRFEFKNVARAVNALDVSASPRNTDVHFALEPGADLESLEFRIPLRCHFRVNVDRWRGQADSFSILDERGDVLSVTVFHGNIGWGEDRVALIDGRSEVGSTHEDARTLVLYRAEQEVGRVTLKLAPGEMNLVRP